MSIFLLFGFEFDYNPLYTTFAACLTNGLDSPHGEGQDGVFNICI